MWTLFLFKLLQREHFCNQEEQWISLFPHGTANVALLCRQMGAVLLLHQQVIISNALACPPRGWTLHYLPICARLDHHRVTETTYWANCSKDHLNSDSLLCHSPLATGNELLAGDACDSAFSAWQILLTRIFSKWKVTYL